MIIRILSLLLFYIQLKESFEQSVHPFKEMLTFTVTNKSPWPSIFYWAQTPCFMEKLCVRLNDGACLPYVGYQLDLEEDPYYYELLWPFQSFSCSFNITDAFYMGRPGIYSIEYQREVAVVTPLETKLSVGESHNLRKRNIWSPWFAIHWGLPSSEIIFMEKLIEPNLNTNLIVENLHADL